MTYLPRATSRPRKSPAEAAGKLAGAAGAAKAEVAAGAGAKAELSARGAGGKAPVDKIDNTAVRGGAGLPKSAEGVRDAAASGALGIGVSGEAGGRVRAGLGGQASLNDDGVPEVLRDLQNGDAEKVIDKALNSDGDKLTLAVGGEGSIGEGVNGGVKVDAEVTLSRKGDKYELAVSKEAAIKLGLEVQEDVESNASIGGSKKNIYTFDNPKDAATALKKLALAEGNPLRNPTTDTASSVVDTTTRATEALTDKNGKVATAARDAITSTIGEGRISRGVDQVFENINRGAGLVRKTNQDIEDGGGILNVGVNKGAKAVKDLAPDGTVIDDAASAVEKQTSAVADAQKFLNDHHTAVEITGKGAIDLALKATPGVSLENISVGPKGEVETSATLRLEYDKDKNLSAVELKQSFDLKQQLDLKLGVGGEVKQTVGADVIQRHELKDGEWKLASHKAVLRADTSLAGSYGVGVAAKGGAANKTSIELEAGPLLNNGGAALDSWLRNDRQGLKDALGDSSVSVSSQNRVEVGVHAGGGFSKAGNGGSIRGKATYEDAFEEQKVELKLADAVDALDSLPERSQNPLLATGAR